MSTNPDTGTLALWRRAGERITVGLPMQALITVARITSQYADLRVTSGRDRVLVRLALRSSTDLIEDLRVYLRCIRRTHIGNLSAHLYLIAPRDLALWRAELYERVLADSACTFAAALAPTA